MLKCIKAKKMFIKALYNELNEDEKTEFENHLKGCDNCAQEYSEMVSAIKMLNERQLPEPEEHFWDNYWLKISGRIKEQTKPESVRNNIMDSIINIFAFRPGLIAYPFVSVLLVSAGLFLGKIIFSPDTDTNTQISLTQKPYNKTLLENRIYDYLDRSKVILSSIENFNIFEDDIYILDIPEQKRISRELISEAQYIRSELANEKEEQLIELIFDLKLILLKIAGLDERTSEFEINLLQTVIKSSALLLKINIEQIKSSPRSIIKNTNELREKSSNS